MPRINTWGGRLGSDLAQAGKGRASGDMIRDLAGVADLADQDEPVCRQPPTLAPNLSRPAIEGAWPAPRAPGLGLRLEEKQPLSGPGGY